MRVRLQGARAAAQLFGKATTFCVACAAVGVNINRARLRQRLFARETIVGEENPAFLWRDGAQAVAAWRGILRHFQVSREAVNWCLQRGADLLRDFSFNSDDAKGLHEIAPSIMLFRA